MSTLWHLDSNGQVTHLSGPSHWLACCSVHSNVSQRRVAWQHDPEQSIECIQYVAAHAGRWENGRPVWMQPLVAAQAEAKTPGGGINGDLVAHALATAAAARGAADQGAALFKDHWQPEGSARTGVRRAVQQAIAAAEAAASIQGQVEAAVSEAVAAVEAAAVAKRKGA